MSRLTVGGVGVGRPYGYSTSDPVGIGEAYRCFEVPRLPGEGEDPAVLELRVHGVGGATPEQILAVPNTLQVTGDDSAGCYRAWYPGATAPKKNPREAYSWGKLDYAGLPSALWILLLPFALVNLAHWMLPTSMQKGVIGYVTRSVLRLLALSLTCLFMATAGFILVDLLAWQSWKHTDVKLPSWAQGVVDWNPGLLAAIALAVLLLALLILWRLSITTAKNYEEWDGDAQPGPSTMKLAQQGFWDAEPTLVLQRCCHIVAGTAVVLAFAGLVTTTVKGSWHGLGTTELWVSGVLLGVAAVLLVCPSLDRLHFLQQRNEAAPGAPRPALAYVDQPLKQVFRWATRGCVVLALAAIVATGAAPLKPTRTAIPDDLGTQSILFLVPVGLVLLLGLLLLVGKVAVSQDDRDTDVMLRGFTPLAVALVGVLFALILGASMIMSAANVLGEPAPHRPAASASAQTVSSKLPKTTTKPVAKPDPGPVYVVPASVYVGGLALLGVGAGGVIAGLTLVGVWHRKAGHSTLTLVKQTYHPDPQATLAQKSVASNWAMSEMTDSLPGALAFTTLVAFGVIVFSVLVTMDVTPHRWGLRHDWSLLDQLATWGTVGGAFLAVALVLRLRQGLKSAAARKQLSTLWDVVTFWPRSVHPLAPPCYAERSVQEVVLRIREVTGDPTLSPKPNVLQTEQGYAWPQVIADPAEGAVPEADAWEQDRTGQAELPAAVLLNGYSQGAPISVAVVAQLSAEARAHTALLTLASPVRRLYGRSFPAYYGPRELEKLAELLGHDPTGPSVCRWRSVFRQSDFVGGRAFAPPKPGSEAAATWLNVAREVDQEIYDPPALWPDDSPVQVPIHRHFDWFTDEQTYPHATWLKATLDPRT